jgi:hypothetical protein
VSLLNRLGSDRIKNVIKLQHGLCANLACRLQSIDLLLQLEKGGSKAFVLCILHNTTRQFIDSDPKRLLAVMNIGKHYHKMEHYKEDLNNRPNDL